AEALSQRRPTGGAATAERRRVEPGELGRRDRATRVARRKVAVGSAEARAIKHGVVDEKRAPEDVGVAGQQRAVEIEQREAPLAGPAHAERRCHARGRVNAWMP